MLRYENCKYSLNFERIAFTCTAHAVELLFLSFVHHSQDSSCSFDLNALQGVFVTGLVRRPLTPMSDTSCHQHLTSVHSIDRDQLLSLRLSSQTVDSSAKLRIRQLCILSEGSLRQRCQYVAPINQTFILSPSSESFAPYCDSFVNRTKTLRYAVPFSSFF